MKNKNRDLTIQECINILEDASFMKGAREVLETIYNSKNHTAISTTKLAEILKYDSRMGVTNRLNPLSKRIEKRYEIIGRPPRSKVVTENYWALFFEDDKPELRLKKNFITAFERLGITSDSQDYSEIHSDEKCSEGSKRPVMVNIYERNPQARRKCIDKYDARCSVCGVDFGERYPGIGDGFIHVHHLKPLSKIGKKYQVDPIEDLRPICPNCHAMLHKLDKQGVTSLEGIERLKTCFTAKQR